MMLITVYTIVFITIVVIIAANIVKNHGKDCVSIDLFGYNLTSGDLVLIAFFWPLAIVYFVLWLIWLALSSVLKLFDKESRS